jgi:hypothetical protein
MSILFPPDTFSLDAEPSRTPYQVLDISPDERDPQVIEEAALRCSSQVRAYQLTCESECTLRLNEIAQALITLLAPAYRCEYDQGLGKLSTSAESERQPAARQDAPLLPRGTDAPPIPEQAPLKLHLGDRETCDVRLVCRRRDL